MLELVKTIQRGRFRGTQRAEFGIEAADWLKLLENIAAHSSEC